MRLSELTTLRLRGRTGWTYGRVHDVRIEWREKDAVITALIVGRRGLRERLFGRGESSEHPHRLGHGSEIPWDQVTAIDDSIIWIKESNP